MEPVVVEYKHGKPKRNEVDEVQLAAQTMCLEEMYAIHIPYGVFFYGELRHRVNVDITDEIAKHCQAMYSRYARGIRQSGYSEGGVWQAL